MVAPIIYVIAVLLLAPPTVDVVGGGAITADSSAYFVERLGEKERQLVGLANSPDLARERLAELQVLKKPEAITKTVKDLDTEINKGMVKADSEEMIELNQVLDQRTQVLTALLDKVPEQARSGIQNALNAPYKKFSREQVINQATTELGSGEIASTKIQNLESQGVVLPTEAELQ